MKLHQHQIEALLDNPIGTGCMLYKLNDTSIRIIPIKVGKDNKTFNLSILTTTQRIKNDVETKQPNPKTIIPNS